jgi:hypothetical protein
MKNSTSQLVRRLQIIAAENNSVGQKRLNFLVSQACTALDACAEKFVNPVFPCALIAGDVVILHLLHEQGLIDRGVLDAMRSHVCCSSDYFFPFQVKIRSFF